MNLVRSEIVFEEITKKSKSEFLSEDILYIQSCQVLQDVSFLTRSDFGSPAFNTGQKHFVT